MSWTKSEVDWCNAAVLPEKIGVVDTELTVFEDNKPFDSAEDALEMIEGQENLTSVVAVKAVVPKLPLEISKAIDDIRGKLPKSREKLQALLQPDPETGEPTWRKRMEEEIFNRFHETKSSSRGCKNCKCSISKEWVKEYRCPVCGFAFLEAEGDVKAFAKVEEKIKALQEEVDGADQKIAELQEKGARETDELKKAWLIFRRDAA